MNADVALLEVLPAHRGRGPGRAIMRRMLDQLGGLCFAALHCDDDRRRFDGHLGLVPLGGMIRRSAGSPPEDGA